MYDSRQGKGFFPLIQNVQTVSEVHPTSYSVIPEACSWGDRGRIEQPERDVDHLSPSNAKIKNEWS